jgi:hypothetical protein
MRVEAALKLLASTLLLRRRVRRRAADVNRALADLPLAGESEEGEQSEKA